MDRQLPVLGGTPAEDAVIGNLLINPALIYESRLLRPDMFTGVNRDIAKIIWDQYAREGQFDVAIIASRLHPSIQNTAYERLSQSNPSNHTTHVEIVHEASLKRSLHQLLEEHKAAIDLSTFMEVSTSLSSKIKNLDAYGDAVTLHIHDTVEKKVIALRDAVNQERVMGTKLHLSVYDEICGGAFPTDLNIIGARPGTGKTSLMCQATLGMARAGVPVGIISCEMATDQLVEVFFAQMTGISRSRMRNATLTADELDRLDEAKETLKNLPIYIDDSTQDWYHIENSVRLLKMRYNIRVVVYDYIQLIRGDRKKDLRIQISDITRAMKKLSKTDSCNLISFALSQLKRNTKKRPTMSDLKESSAIEENADSILFLWHEGEVIREKDKPEMKLIKMAFEKNRAGATHGEDECHEMLLHHNQFREYFGKDDDRTFITPKKYINANDATIGEDDDLPF